MIHHLRPHVWRMLIWLISFKVLAVLVGVEVGVADVQYLRLAWCNEVTAVDHYDEDLGMSL